MGEGADCGLWLLFHIRGWGEEGGGKEMLIVLRNWIVMWSEWKRYSSIALLWSDVVVIRLSHKTTIIKPLTYLISDPLQWVISISIPTSRLSVRPLILPLGFWILWVNLCQCQTHQSFEISDLPKASLVTAWVCPTLCDPFERVDSRNISGWNLFAKSIPQRSYLTFLPPAVAFKSLSMISSNGSTQSLTALRLSSSQTSLAVSAPRGSRPCQCRKNSGKAVFACPCSRIGVLFEFFGS